MKQLRTKSEEIRKFILDKVETHSSDITKLTAQHFGLTRQAINKHLQNLVKEKSLIVSGQTRNKHFKLAPLLDWQEGYIITPLIAEDLVWRNRIKSVLGEMPDNVIEIWHYGFTEMLNNVIDHSAASHVSIQIEKTAKNTKMIIADDGVGIFKKIQASLNLIDESHALFELSKGKLTTDPKNHSGEGIFFTSRMFDSFDIISGGVHFSHEFKSEEDWVLEGMGSEGTTIVMKLNNHTVRKVKKVFDQFTTDKNYGFNKTIIPVKLALYGNDRLISRSQAKRLVARIELFKIVIFDFQGVDTIGQAFADEIFRVFANLNPTIELLTIHTNLNVLQMINRAKTKI
ncbi:MAG: DUF4325 domain-containing protein [Tatlockia sp.]|nr:DUF4325 domain-containing protein [Tatlockia sp.]